MRINEKSVIISIALYLILSETIFSQDYSMFYNSKNVIEVCSGNIYDNGGEYGNYLHDSRDTLVIMPQVPGNKVYLDFQYMDVQRYRDTITIYDGVTTNSPKIGYFFDVPGTIVASNSSGALTLVFQSNAMESYQGFKAVVACSDTMPNIDVEIELYGTQAQTRIAGIPFTYYSWVKNYSSALISNIYVSYYLSQDTLLDSSDDSLTSFFIQYINPGRIESQYNQVATPTNTPEGDYFLLAYVHGADGAIDATIENNVTAEPVSILSSEIDMQVSDFKIMSETLSPPLPNVSNVLERGANKVKCNVKNIGNTWAPVQDMAIYLSEDPVLDTNDLEFLFETTKILPNEEKEFELEVFIDSTALLIDGIYYLIVMVDAGEEVVESDEGNNLYIMQVPFMDKGTPPNGVNVGINSFRLSYDSVAVGNRLIAYLGIEDNLIFEEFLTGFYLSKDSILNKEEDYLFYQAANTRWSIPRTLSINFDLSGSSISYYGDCYVIACMDSHESIDEIDEKDNVIYHRIYLDSVRKTDVIAEDVMTLDTIILGDNLKVRWKVKNQGNARTEDRINVGFYLSRDDIYDGSDILLGYTDAYYLMAGRSSNVMSTSLNITSYDTGSYYLVTHVDYENTINEIREYNNVSFTPFKVVHEEVYSGDDINLLDISIPGTIRKGQEFTVNYSIASEYLNDIKTKLSCFISQDSIFDESDFHNELFSRNINLQSSKLSTFTLEHTVPENVNSGKYFLIFKIDKDNCFFEKNESNNILIIPIIVLEKTVDLDLYRLLLEKTVISNNCFITGSMLIGNSFRNTADSAHLELYLTDTSISSLGNLFWRDTIYSVGRHYREQTFTVRMPDTINEGLYYLTARIRSQDAIEDTKLCNNTKQHLIGVQNPDNDFEILSVYLDNRVCSLSTDIAVEYELINNGTSSDIVRVGYYLSNDTIFSPDDEFIGDEAISQLVIQTKKRVSSHFSVPSHIYGGTYQLFLVINPNNELFEHTDTNNIVREEIEVIQYGADVAIDALSLNKNSFLVGEELGLSFTRKNIGDVMIYYCMSGFYLSTDTILDQSDLLLYEYSWALDSGQVRECGPFRLNTEGIEEGSYYILCKEDNANTIMELDEHNNIGYYPFTLSEPVVDFDIIQLDYQDSIISIIGRTTGGITCNIVNNGLHVPNKDVTLAQYISVDTVLNVMEDALIDYHFTNYSVLGENDTLNQRSSFRIPEMFPAGNYYLFYVVDHSNSFSEIDELNNIFRTTIKVIEPNINLTIDAGLSSYEILKGSSFNYSCAIQNTGTTSTEGYFRATLFLSNDTLYSTDDELLVERYLNTIEAGEIEEIEGEYYLPTYSRRAGDQYVLYIVDHFDRIQEINESDNLLWEDISILEADIDIIVESISAQNVICEQGAYMDISYEIRNNGRSNIDRSFYNRFYLSEDDVFDENDLHVGGSYVTDDVKGGTSIDVQGSFRMPVGYDLGVKYLFIVADVENTIQETNESNISDWFQIEVIEPYVDLVVTYARLFEYVYYPWEDIDFYFTARNAGQVDLDEDFDVDYYISKDTIYDMNDIRLSEGRQRRYRGDNYMEVSGDYKLPDLEYGKYYLLLVIDKWEHINEFNELNNIHAEEFVVYMNDNFIDLSVSLSDLLEPNIVDSVQIKSVIQNRGLENSNYGRIEFYLSNNNQFDGSDILLERIQLDTIESFDSQIINLQAAIPSDVHGGTYYLIAIVHNYSEIPDVELLNNIAVSEIYIDRPINTTNTIASNHIMLYPNPASNYICIETEIIKYDYTIVDHLGRVMRAGVLSNKMDILDVSDLVEGIYFMYSNTYPGFVKQIEIIR